VSQDRVRKIRFFSREAYISVDTKEQSESYGLRERPSSRSTSRQQAGAIARRAGSVPRVRANAPAPTRERRGCLAAVELAIRVADAIEESMRRSIPRMLQGAGKEGNDERTIGIIGGSASIK